MELLEVLVDLREYLVDRYHPGTSELLSSMTEQTLTGSSFLTVEAVLLWSSAVSGAGRGRAGSEDARPAVPEKKEWQGITGVDRTFSLSSYCLRVLDRSRDGDTRRCSGCT